MNDNHPDSKKKEAQSIQINNICENKKLIKIALHRNDDDDDHYNHYDNDDRQHPIVID